MPDNNSNFKFKLGVDLDLDSIQSQLEKLNTQNRKINVGINVEDSEFNKVVNDLERSLKRIDTSSVAKSFKSTKDSIMKDINDLTREFSFEDIKTDGFKKATESISKSISTLRDDIRIFKVEQNEMINPNIFNAQKQKALSDYNKLLNSNTASMSKLKTEADMVFKSLNSASTPKELTAANQQLQLLQKNVQTLNSLNLNNLEKEAQQVQDRFSSAIKTLTDLNNLESRLNNISAKSTGSDHLLNQSANLQNRVGSLKDDVYAQADLDGIVDEATINKYKELRDEVNLLNSEFKQYQQTVKQTEKAEKDLSQNNAFELNKAKSLQEIEAYMTNNSKAVQQFGTSLNDLKQRIADVGDQSSLTSLNKEFGILKKQIDAVGASGRTFGAELANDIGKFGTWLGAGTILMSGINGVQNAFQQIVGLDDAMIELRKVTDETEESYRNFYYTANELAKEFGATTQEVIDATATWAQTGYNIQEAAQLAQNSIVLSTISEDLSVEESTDALISAMRGFQLEADEVLDGIVSKVNVVGKRLPLIHYIG